MSDREDGDPATEELEPAEALEELLEEIIDGLQPRGRARGR